MFAYIKSVALLLEWLKDRPGLCPQDRSSVPEDEEKFFFLVASLSPRPDC